MDEIKFSIVTPIYNREAHVQHLVQSVQAQTYENWELILVDDGSIDQTGEKCQACANEDSRIRYIHKQNGGVSTARNCGINYATGEYVLFLDSDNSLLNNALIVLASKIKYCPQADFLCFGYRSVSGDWYPCGEDDFTIISREDIRKNYLPVHINIVPQARFFLKNFVWNKCYKREFLNICRIRFDENRRTWEDGQFVVNCLDCANVVLQIREVLYDDSCPICSEHLSAKLFDDQIQNYVKDEEDYYRRFSSELNFDSPHYCRSNFDVLNMLFERSVNTYGEKALSLIDWAIHETIVVHWVQNISPSNLFEKKIKESIISGNTSRIYHLYRLRQLKGAIKSLYYRVVVIRAPLQGLCYTVRDAVDW